MFNEDTVTYLVTEALVDQNQAQLKKMFQGVAFMVDDKLCLCVRRQDMLCRIGEQQAQHELEKGHCRQMIHNGRIMKDFVFVEYGDLHNTQHVRYWIDLALQFNPQAQSSRKRVK